MPTRQLANNVYIVDTSTPNILSNDQTTGTTTQTNKSITSTTTGLTKDQSKEDLLQKQKEKRQTVKELLSKFENK